MQIGSVSAILRRICILLAVLAAGTALAGTQLQTVPTAPDTRRQFEVASIKPDNSGLPLPTVGTPLVFSPGGRFTATNVTLVDVIVRVYPTRRIQMQGGPVWIDSDRFDIVAKADEQDGEVRPEQRNQMIQRLLEDRFKLKFHVEPRETNVYVVVTGKETPKLQEPKDGEVAGLIRGPNGQLIFQRTTIGTLVNTMANILRTPVVDGTGIKGNYDFTLDPLKFAEPEKKFDYADVIVEAVQEGVGLTLERRKQSLDITVIDHAEKPTQN